jgi:hypothetical protein
MKIVEFTRRLVDDIPECHEEKCDIILRYIGLIPVLILAFNIPETIHQPALAIRLTSFVKSKPLSTGNVLEGDRLKRHIRDSVEHYLTKNGVKLPILIEE